MDGNNRWARTRGLASKDGHRRGAESALAIVNCCIEWQIPYLTLFAFSSENWMRPNAEVQSLIALFMSVLKRHEINELHKKGAKIRFIGRRSEFPNKLMRSMQEVERQTSSNPGTSVTIAADYGGRWDIANAAQTIAQAVERGELQSGDIDSDLVSAYISTAGVPDPDLCIRTGGEHRISNFLLWQFAYTELYFTECYWPEFDAREFQSALDDFASRQRRFGGQEVSHPASS